MAVHIVRLGSERKKREGLRIGTVRHPPRGVRKEDFAKENYFDAWLPELSPSAELVSWAREKPWTEKRWSTFARRYTSEMRKPASDRLLALIAALSRDTDLSVGCYCEDETRCHRILLRELLAKHGAVMAG